VTSRADYELGRRARGVVEDSRQRVTALLERSSDEIVITSRGTEANK
jgi:cysteine sulfinate desulfinase/cysteine desulfurase-like protein